MTARRQDTRPDGREVTWTRAALAGAVRRLDTAAGTLACDGGEFAMSPGAGRRVARGAALLAALAAVGLMVGLGWRR